ncbi:hypothetical protein BV20DRAFT_1120521 [Pilatotrama ljubarskyi]|nr:hypothetical protein BV20DRAFT_1120521 [Pilatotrama ljubarskyi]
MMRDWFLYNIDKKEKADSLLSGDLNKILRGDTSANDPGGHLALLSSLRTPSSPKEIEGWLSTGQVAAQRGPIWKFPAEMLDQIIEELDMQDAYVVTLAITCKALLEVSKRHLLAVLRELHAPWQNNRLILLGVSTSGRAALPPGLLTDAEWEEMTSTAVFGAFDSSDDLPGSNRRRLARIPQKLCVPAAAGSNTGLSEYRMFSVLWGSTGVTYPEGPLVLCNVSKGEYVLEEGLPGAGHLSAPLAHALLALIVWTTDPADSRSLDCPSSIREELIRGPWAGDRFCVVTICSLPRLENGVAGWTDVSAQAARLLSHLGLDFVCRKKGA